MDDGAEDMTSMKIMFFNDAMMMMDSLCRCVARHSSVLGRQSEFAKRF
jgi:hypothetical protein